MKKLCLLILCLCMMLPSLMLPIYGEEAKKQGETKSGELAASAKGVYLCENTTGKVIYARNEKEKLYPASMTKMMGLLLIFESLNDNKLKWDDTVTASEYAAGMGGSQVFLEPGETMSVTDMVKSICIASANDSMMAMAEKIGGSNEGFVEMMNEKAKDLKLENTHFVNPTGLHDPDHYSCAKDMAIIAQALIREGGDELLQITSTYDAYIREESDSKFWLVNTNKLLKQYPGVDGLKTGFTTEALSCITTTAKKDGLRLIGVVMGEPSSKVRNTEMKQLLDYGFSQYEQSILYKKGTIIQSMTLENGKPGSVDLKTMEDAVYVYRKGDQPKETKKEISIEQENLPYKKDAKIGRMHIEMSDGYTMEVDIACDHDVEALNFVDIFMKTFEDIFVNS